MDSKFRMGKYLCKVISFDIYIKNISIQMRQNIQKTITPTFCQYHIECKGFLNTMLHNVANGIDNKIYYLFSNNASNVNAH
jgi:hypothetical protein